jgi:hypothetical protein
MEAKIMLREEGKMKDVMVDIETLGNGNRACIVQIGACYFDRKTGEIGKTFKVNIDAATAVASGAEMDASTVYWWLSQSKEAIESITKDPKVPIKQAMEDLNQFFQGAKCIWSHATFDFVIIQGTLRRLGIKPLFQYKSARDIRTLMDLSGIKKSEAKRVGTHHDGLDDAIFQVAYCVEAMNALIK